MDAVRSSDADRLLQLAARKSAQGRETLYRTLWDFFEQRGGALTDAERTLMTEILRQLSREIEMSIRMELAKRLAGRNDAPRDLARILADQEIEVAFPILMESRVLQDVDLIEVVRNRSHQHRLAIAMRQDIGSTICEALAERREVDVVVRMLQNPTALLGETLMGRLAEESREVTDYQEPLIRRPDLPPLLARRMCTWVSAALRHFILKQFDFDPDTLDDEISETIRDIPPADLDSAPRSPVETMVERMARSGKLTVDFLVRTLRRAEIATFEAAFAQLAGLRVRLARRILYEEGGEAFAIACIAARIDRANCLLIFELTRRALDITPAEIAAQTRELGNFYDSTTPAGAEVVVRRWRRDPGYLSALKQIGGAA